MPDRLGWRRQPCLCLDGSVVVLLMSELYKTLEYEFLDPPNASVVQQAKCRTGSRLCCCAASSPFKSFPVLSKRLWPFGEDVFLAMSPHTASQKYSFDWRHVSFHASSSSLSPLQGLQPRQFPQNTGSKEEPLLTTPLYGGLHLHTFPRICWRSSERRKVRVIVDRPRLCRASSVDANVGGLKNSNTHQRIAKAILLSFDAPSSRTLKLNKASLHYFRRPCHHLRVALPWFLSALGFSIVMSCNLQAEASVTGGSMVDFEGSFFFFRYWYFRKKLRTRATRNKENNNSGLKEFFSFTENSMYSWVRVLDCGRVT